MELCVMCGRELPNESGSQVCRTCLLTSDVSFMKFDCPECGMPLDIYYTEVTEHTPASWDCFRTLGVDLIYHCDYCGCDWDSKYHTCNGDVGQTGLTRHFWG